MKYFNDLHIESIFESDEGLRKRSFTMGKQTDFIENEKVEVYPEGEIGTRVTLQTIKSRRFPDKQVTAIAQTLVERLLPYFIDKSYVCPIVTIAEEDGSQRINLNDFLNNKLSELVQEIPLKKGTLVLGEEGASKTFLARVFKIFSPRTTQSKVSLVANGREVTETGIHNFVPEFDGEPFEESDASNPKSNRNYVIKAYVFGDYLDECVSLERGRFEFPDSNDLIDTVSKTSIEREVALVARDALGSIITERQEKKRDHVQEYVASNAPWHSTIVDEVDLTLMPLKPSPEQIEEFFQKEKFNQEVAIRKQVNEILSQSDGNGIQKGLPDIIKQISKTSRNDLIHYIALRKHVLSLFSKSIELGEDKKFSSEGKVHNIIFPLRSDSKSLPFKDHNLWIIDERLNFTEYVSSDKPLEGGVPDRPDLIAFDNPVLFRGDNSPSNPVSIFEFKKPGREDFTNPSSRCG